MQAIKEVENKTEHNIRLTSSELSSLWNTYMSDSLTSCFLKYFLAKVQDTDIKPVIEYTLDSCQKQLQRVTDIFKTENVPIPEGFGDNDVTTNAPQLYSDTFFLNYIHHMSRYGMGLHSFALSVSARSDVRSFYNDAINFSKETHNKATEVLLKKGLYIRSPYISIPEKIDYVSKQSYLSGFFRETRPLNAAEITHYYNNIQMNSLGKALLIGFSQVAQSKDVREILVRGRELCKVQIQEFSELFLKDNLPVPMSWDTDIMDVKVSPFSDKLMLFHVASLLSLFVLNYGGSIAITFRRDLIRQYTKFIDDLVLYAEDVANLMIKNGWLEEMPQADNRDALAKA